MRPTVSLARCEDTGVTHEIISQSTERIRHAVDWIVRGHPTVAAGVAGVAIIVAGAYVALDAESAPGAPGTSRPPAVAGAVPPASQAPAAPSRTAPAVPKAPETAGPERDSRPRSGPGAPPDAVRPPQTGVADAPVARANPAQAPSPGGGTSGGSGGGGGPEPAPAEPPAAQPPPSSQPPAAQPEEDCVLRVNLLGDLVRVCL